MLLLLTLILLEAKVISPCQQYRARSACKSVQSDQALYCKLRLNFQVLILISQKKVMGSCNDKKQILKWKKVDYSIKEIQQVNG